MVRKHIEKIPVRREDSHKGDYGRIFVVAGSPGMTGAAFLCSEGALRTGSGLVTCGIAESLNPVMEVKLTEVMTLPLTETQSHALGLAAEKEILKFAKKCDVAVVGPGLGSDPETKPLVKILVQQIESPIVLDADGINGLEGDIDVLKDRSARLVLTPHPGEMSKLIGKDVSEIQSMREDIAKSVAEVTGAVVCLKGHRTVVASPEGEVYVNETGNSGMATGGMGDILTGMIASFIGQGVDDFGSCVIAVNLHGLAGDIAAEKKGQFNMVATNVLEYLPEAFKRAGI
ncbi:MAG: NAD(P)H-hydrate dehydratase [Candidatus Omnitrophota bacterium]